MIRALYSLNDSRPLSLADLSDLVSLNEIGHLTQFTVRSWSMYPTLKKGDRIVLGPADVLKPDDLVVYRRGQELICHRVIGVEGQALVRTLGDAAQGPGELVRRSDICGIVHVIDRHGARFVPAARPATLPAPSLRMYLDFWVAEQRHRLHHVPRRVLRWPGVRSLVVAVLRRWARLTVTAPAELRSLSAFATCREVDDSVGPTEIHPNRVLPRTIQLQIRLFGYRIGFYDPTFNRLILREQLSGVGLEKALSHLCVSSQA